MNRHWIRMFPAVCALLAGIAAGGAWGTARAELAPETLAQLTDRLRSQPDDAVLRRQLIRAAGALKPAPAIPEEARRFFIRGNTALEDAQGPEGVQRAIRHFEEALKSAPWWGEAYRRLAQAREQNRDYSRAIDALGFYLLTGPAAADARQAQDRIYVLEEKRDEAAQAAGPTSAPAAVPPAAQAPAQAPALAPMPVAAATVSVAGVVAAPVAPAVSVASAPPATPVAPAFPVGVAPSAQAVQPTGAVFRDCPECPEMLAIRPGLAIGRYPVTQQQWQDLMGSNPSFFRDCGPTCPVENVSWNDAQQYVARLAEKTGRRYALPSEAQWESACQAGTQPDSCGGLPYDAAAWTLRNSGARPHPVGTKQATALGLYDMNGNVWEWTTDCSKDDCRYRVLRGGSWSFDPQFSGARKRIGIDASRRLNDYGLRVVRLLP